MAYSKPYNIARMTTATTGTGPVALGSAVAGHLTFAQAGVQNGDIVSYALKDGSQTEVGQGTYSTTGPTLYRTTVTNSTNSNAAINLATGAAEVYITLLAADVIQVGASGHTFPAPLDISAAASGQIMFPATQNASADANVLDDYEEGTFTPSVTFGGGSTGITYTTQNGIYTKIGRTVLYNITVTLSNKGSSTGAMVITGLPFTSAATHNYSADVGFAGSFTGLTGALTVFTAPSTTQIFIYQSAAGTYGVVTNAAATNTTQIRVSGFYQT